MNFELSDRSEAWREKLQAFFDQEVLPRHRAWLGHIAKGEAPPFMADRQQKARAAGLCGPGECVRRGEGWPWSGQSGGGAPRPP